MSPTPAPTRPLRALAALIAAAAVLHGLCAHAGETDDADIDADADARVQVVGHHLPLRTACADADDELADGLAQAWQDYGAATTVPVEFKLRGSQVYDVQLATESPRLSRQLRRAVRDMSCDSGDDEVHVVDLVVHFVDPAGARDGGTRVAIDDAHE